MSGRTNGESTKPTPYAVNCPVHGLVYMTDDEYLAQLDRFDERWTCPRMSAEADDDFGLCGRTSTFDDEIYEANQEL